jgi:hypothetical protein
MHFRAKKGYTGLLVGQCNEFPAIIVQGKTLLDLRKELLDGLNWYLKAFPQRKQEMIEKYAILIQSEEQIKQTDQKILKNEEDLQKHQEYFDQQEVPITEEWQEQVITVKV